MRIGTVSVRMAGIGGVYTERQHRMKGYMRHLYADTVTYMTSEGYDVSMLFGIPNFYTKFGYAASLATYQFTVHTRDAEAAGPAKRSPRPVTKADMPAIVRLYNEKNATRTCSIVRSAEAFTEFEHGSDWGIRTEPWLWEDNEGGLLAYAVTDRTPTAVIVCELGARDDRMFPEILSDMVQRAIKKRCERITFFLPPDHPFAEYAQRHGTEWTIGYPRYSDGMMRILNQDTLFEKLVPELGRRAAAQGIKAGNISLVTELGKTALVVRDSAVGVQPEAVPGSRLELPQHALVQLVVGYRSVRDVLNSAETELTSGDKGLELLDALFPRGIAFVWKPDYF
jgi:predicted acetyltransferase